MQHFSCQTNGVQINKSDKNLDVALFSVSKYLQASSSPSYSETPTKR